MSKSEVVIEDAPAAPAISPEMLSKLKKEDMKQAVVERFKGSIESMAPRATRSAKKRSPYWQAADPEC